MPGMEPNGAHEPATDVTGLPLDAPEGVHASAASPELLDLAELARQLDGDPGEWGRAVAGLESLDAATRIELIRELGSLPRGPGVAGLLGLLADSDLEDARAAARAALAQQGEIAIPAWAGMGPRGVATARPRPVHGLVTTPDGEGRATIGLSSTLGGERRTALFQCDVGRGITRANGEVEPEGPGAGGLLACLSFESHGPRAVDAPQLAADLLSACLWLAGPDPVPGVRHWLDAVLGADFQARPYWISAEAPGAGLPEDQPAGELLWWAFRIVDECPAWLDRSPLTYALAEEIVLREGRVSADSRRDAGAFRYLFEHQILGKLELYRRMLLWMARFWESAGERELAGAAAAFAVQLSDEQFAVPGQPFVQAIAARSLDAAGASLGTAADPRPRRE